MPITLHQQLICALLAAVLCTGCASAQTAPAPPPAPPQQTVQVGGTTVLAVGPAPAPCCAKQTLPQFLGLTGLAQGLGGLGRRIVSRSVAGLGLTGRFPGLQARPPLVSLTDPANLQPDAPPALQAAAKAKAEEDAAEQKIMALRYLATLGCGGCYHEVEDALLAALDDCTERVRYEAALALRGKSAFACRFCSSTRCCSPAVLKKLNAIANETDDAGCHREPSPRVRRIARIAMASCGGPVFETTPPVPAEGPPDIPFPAEGPVGLTNRPPLFDGIQLVSFDQPIAKSDMPDMILARVNGEPIFESQVLPLVEARIAAGIMGGTTSTDPRFRRAMTTRELQRVIEWKLLFQQAARELRPPGQPGATLPLSSYEVQQWLERRMSVDADVPPQHVVAYYEANRARFETPARSRWERIAVPIAGFPSKDHAQRVAAYLRNQAMGIQSEAPPFGREQVELETIGWTELAQVPSPLLRQTLANQPVGQISPILDEGSELLVVRVLERRPGELAPIHQVAAQIRDELVGERRTAIERQLMAHLRATGNIWTVFDAPPHAPHQPENAQHAAVPLQANGQQPDAGSQPTVVPANTTAPTRSVLVPPADCKCGNH